MMTSHHWKMSLYCGMHFSWILSLPLWGPFLSRVLSIHQLNQILFGLIFLIGSASTYVYLANLRREMEQRRIIWCLWGILALTSLIISVSIPLWIYLFLLLAGFCSAMVVSHWFNQLVSQVEMNMRSRVIGMAILIANAILYAGIQLNSLFSHSFIFIWILVWMIGPILLWKELCLSGLADPLEENQSNEVFRLGIRRKIFFLLFVALYFSAGSAINESLFAGLSIEPNSILERHSLIPYMFVVGFFCLVRPTVNLVSFLVCSVLFGIGIIIHLVGDVFIMKAFAALVSMSAIGLADLFLWTFLAQQKWKYAHSVFCISLATQLFAIGSFSVVQSILVIEDYVFGLSAGLLFVSVIPLYLSFSPNEESGNSRESHREMALQQLHSILTPREKDVLNLLVKGYSNENIAQEIYVSVATVRSHLRNIYRKTGFSNRNTLLSWIIIGDGGPEELDRKIK